MMSVNIKSIVSSNGGSAGNTVDLQNVQVSYVLLSCEHEHAVYSKL